MCLVINFRRKISMAIRIFKKLRDELYKMSEIEQSEDSIQIESFEENKSILYFLESSKTLRNKSDSEIIDCFIPTLTYNKLLAIKSLFYIRDKVFGLGERRIFKVLINYLAFNERDILSKNIHLIYKYGRWDDYYALFYTPLEIEVIEIFRHQLSIDLNSETPSTLAKWLKSENTSSKISKKLAIRTRNLLGYTSQEYRIILSSLRKKIGIVESKISKMDFNSIDYNNLPISTCLRYRNTFIRNDKIRYMKHIKLYNKKFNNKLLNMQIHNLNQTPLNIVESIINNKNINSKTEEIYDNIWSTVCSNYKDFFQDTYVIISISQEGYSVCSTAYKVALSTVLFYKTSNSSTYKNYYMYLNSQPHFSKIHESGVVRQLNKLKEINLSSSNNIESALDLLLFTSIKNDLSNDKIPNNILIISDSNLEHRYKNSNNVQLIKNKWGLSGYIVPNLKFWQIENSGLPKSISKDIYSNTFIRGYSKEIFISLLKKESVTSDELILKPLENSRYNCIG